MSTSLQLSTGHTSLEGSGSPESSQTVVRRHDALRRTQDAPTDENDDLDVTADLHRTNSFDFVIARSNELDITMGSRATDAELNTSAAMLRKESPRRAPCTIDDNASIHQNRVSVNPASEPYREEIELDDLSKASASVRRTRVGHGRASSRQSASSGVVESPDGKGNARASDSEWASFPSFAGSSDSYRKMEEGRALEQNQEGGTRFSWLVKNIVSFFCRPS